MKLLFITAAMFFVTSANATTAFWQAVGVEVYQHTNAPIKAIEFNAESFASLESCNAAIANHNQMMPAGTKTPTLIGEESTAVSAKANVDAICHQVLPLQMPGWYAYGTSQVKEGTQQATPVRVKIGPLQSKSLCVAAIENQKKLTLQKSPIYEKTISYSLNAECHKLY